MVRKWLFIVILLYVNAVSLNKAHSFSRTFKMKRNATEKVGKGRFVKAIRKLTRIDPIPEIPEVPTAEPKQIIGELDDDTFEYDTCSVTNLCMNNGTCISHRNDYFCNCPSTHYGKTCEFKADQSKCEGNMCMNNATCYSTKEDRIVPNILMKSGGAKTPTTFVKYECWCRYGFQGSFCEFSEQMRHCAEDRCNHHGIVVPFEAGETKGDDCKCHCEQHYSGAECEIISPCRDLECTNNSTCVLDKISGLASCKCPTDVKILPVTVTGELCENAIIPDKFVKDDCVPCQSNFIKYLWCLGKKNNGKLSLKDLHIWLGDFLTLNEKEKLPFENHFKHHDCFNDGACQVGVGQLPLDASHELYGHLFLIPKCQCLDGFEGNFCELKLRNECEDQPEVDENMKRCVHGKCIFNATDGTVECICDEGYRGIRCETKDPCMPNPCENGAICVEFPLSHTFSDDDLKHTCVCKTSQSVDEIKHTCKNEHYVNCERLDGSPMCENDGNCYPCMLDSPEVKILALCDEAERRRKFRCICPPGFQPPFCRANVTACDSHSCQNDGECEPIPGRSLDYRCKCPPGFNGTFCHISLGICPQKGDAICVNGKCVFDKQIQRRFRCDCEEGYQGFNCDILIERQLLATIQAQFAWTFPLIAFFICGAILVIFGILLRRKTERNVTA